MESKVDDTLSDSSGSFRKTNVIPLAFEKTRMTKPESLKSLRVIWTGMVSGELAASGFGEVNDGVVER